ncbi:unnamed protein product [Rhizopus stolonifer]
MIPFYAEELGNINILRATVWTEKDINLAESLEVKTNVLSFNSKTIANVSTVGLSISAENLVVSRINNTGNDLSAWEVKIYMTGRNQQLRSQQTEAKEWWNTTYLKSRVDKCEAFTCKCVKHLYFQ